MGKSSAGHIVRGLRGIFRPKARPPTVPTPSPTVPSPPPIIHATSPAPTPPPVISAPQNPPDACKKARSSQETEQDKPRDKLLLDEEVKEYVITSLFLFSSLLQPGFKI